MNVIIYGSTSIIKPKVIYGVITHWGLRLLPCCISLPIATLLSVSILNFCTSLEFLTHILLVHPILFTTYTISTSYTNIRHTIFDV
jgi:hypothetical protein